MKAAILDVNELKNIELYQYWYEKMSKSRREKVDRIHFEGDRRLSLGAGILLHKALLEYGLNEKKVEIIQGEHGKPMIKGHDTIYFNLSHSGERAVCAWGDQPVGIDIERTDLSDKKWKRSENVAKRFFHPDEYGYLMSLEKEEDRRDTFYKIWVKKESYLKVTGRGMSLPMNEFQVLCDPIFSYKTFSLFDYEIAVCSNEPIDEIVLKNVSIQSEKLA